MFCVPFFSFFFFLKGGFVDIDDIADKYNAKTNPDVMSGKKTEKQVLKEFLDTFDQGEKDGKVMVGKKDGKVMVGEEDGKLMVVALNGV